MANKEQAKNPNAVMEIEIDSSPEKSDSDGTPIRPIFCVKKRENIKKLEESEECFILDFDPYDDDGIKDSLDTSKKLSVKKNLDFGLGCDVFVVSEKGKVACRDFPHPRHVCVKYQFERTAHESYCNLCYCYVCDSPAPCKYWTGSSGHCHAIDNAAWKLQRNATRQALKPRN